LKTHFPRNWRPGAAALAALLTFGLIVTSAVAKPKPQKHFEATLLGENEQPVPRETPASGFARVKIDPHDRWLDISVDVADIENVVGAHIHIITNPDGTGPVVVGLFGDVPGGGPFEGRLVDLRIFPDDVLTSTPLPDVDWEDLLTAIRSGTAYVNVHTNDGVAPTNTGPGDFPGGEIYGLLEPK
jgi:hypothetical protein